MRRRSSYQRRGPIREPYDFVLIVCEGLKTEQKYFQRLKEVFRLSSANIEIARPDATDPWSLVKFAEQRLQDRDYNRAYCVFDRDGHATYDRAINHISRTYGTEGRLRAIASVPCFEIWILLHFRYTSEAFNSVGGRSACDRVMSKVKTHFADYAKGHQDVYDRLAPNRDQAMINAARLLKENIRTGSVNPGTQVHKLVEYLCNLKK